MASPTVTVAWRLPPDLYEAIKAEAARRQISMNALAIEKLSK